MFRISRTGKKMQAAAMGAVLCVCAGAAAQTPSLEDNAFQQHEYAEASMCMLYGCNGNRSAAQPPRIGYDPCYLAQNAIRPCNTAEVAGVDPELVGTWELPFKSGPWVLEIKSNGTYRFHSEAQDGIPNATGTFSAKDGNWSLNARRGFSDFGNYKVQASDVFIAAGQHGAVAWLRPDFAQRVMQPCAPPANPKAKPPANAKANAKANVAAKVYPDIDPDLVGTWELPVGMGGPWVWEIARDATYKFHSEALDMAPPHAGDIFAKDFHWSLQATDGLPGYKDTGLYLFQFPNVLMATSERFAGGGVAWLRPASATCMP